MVYHGGLCGNVIVVVVIVVDYCALLGGSYQSNLGIRVGLLLHHHHHHHVGVHAGGGGRRLVGGLELGLEHGDLELLGGYGLGGGRLLLGLLLRLLLVGVQKGHGGTLGRIFVVWLHLLN